MAFFGIEWVESYNGLFPSLSFAKEEAQGFRDAMRLTGVSGMFERGNSTARDQDFEEQGWGLPFAGLDTSIVEKADIVYYCGHGEISGLKFGSTTSDDGTAKPSEIKWGNGGVLKWVVLDCCWALHSRSTATPVGSDTVTRWKTAFAGLHQILGFRTACTDEDLRGAAFGEYLADGNTTRTAWRKACEETEPSDRQWALLRATGSYYDHLPGAGTVGTASSTALPTYEWGNC